MKMMQILKGLIPRQINARACAVNHDLNKCDGCWLRAVTSWADLRLAAAPAQGAAASTFEARLRMADVRAIR